MAGKGEDAVERAEWRGRTQYNVGGSVGGPRRTSRERRGTGSRERGRGSERKNSDVTWKNSNVNLGKIGTTISDAAGRGKLARREAGRHRNLSDWQRKH